MDFFEKRAQKASDAFKPLAELLRPTALDGFIGQKHLVGENGIIRKAIESHTLFSMILWGPPGCGKTTLAKIMASHSQAYFTQISAVLSGVKEIRWVIDKAQQQLEAYQQRTLLFVDEIHRFNKSQQDAFLPHVESGLITLIGATTENPSFEVISALLSRCRVLTLNPLTDSEMTQLLNQAVQKHHAFAETGQCIIDDDAMEYAVRLADGDARYALNALEIAINYLASQHSDQASGPKDIHLSLVDMENVLQKKALIHDKKGDAHYNLISAFHKSMRGSDPDAALYWLARMLTAGEDPLYIARRMIRFASEDVGCADSFALSVALNAMEAYRFLGYPEGELALAHGVIYLSTAPKSNRTYEAYNEIKKEIESSGDLAVPFNIRNAPTGLMKSLGYGKDYQYDHDHPHALAAQRLLPEELEDHIFYRPTNRGYEKIIKDRLDRWRELKNRLKRQE